jgi:hypothetical protein
LQRDHSFPLLPDPRRLIRRPPPPHLWNVRMLVGWESPPWIDRHCSQRGQLTAVQGGGRPSGWSINREISKGQ